MNEQELIAHAETALRELGYIFYCPERVWQAYSEGLLKSRYVGKCQNVIPQRTWQRLKHFFVGQEVFQGEVVQEAAILPSPNFTDDSEWDTAITHYGLKGVGGGSTTKSRPYCSIHACSDGSVSELMKIPITLRVGIHSIPDEEFWKIERSLKEIMHLSPFRRSRDWWLLCYLIIQINFFSKERVAKTRRRVEDRLRKGRPDDVIRLAKSLGIV